jgi:rare lipoprotein A
MGTSVRVTNLANGATVTCRVADRGPFVAGRIIDLDREDFDRIASASTGVIDVRIEW